MLTVNHRFCRKARQAWAIGLLLCTALTALALPIRAYAQFTGKAFALHADIRTQAVAQ
jgi:hypothetical protein